MGGRVGGPMGGFKFEMNLSNKSIKRIPRHKTPREEHDLLTFEYPRCFTFTRAKIMVRNVL